MCFKLFLSFLFGSFRGSFSRGFHRGFFRNYLAAYNNMSGAAVNAGKATGTLRIVEYGQIILHRNCAVGANSCALTASYTADLAHAHNFYCLAV